MKPSYLEVTYRDGRFVAAYLYLSGSGAEHSTRTEKTKGGLLVDFAEDGRAIGVEILSPKGFTLSELNTVLKHNGQTPLRKKDVAPILAT